MQDKINLHLFTRECQNFFIKKKSQQYSIYHHVEQKLKRLHYKILGDNLAATIYGKITYQRIVTYIEDITSEIKKYHSVIKNDEIIATIQGSLSAIRFPLLKINRLTQLLNEAIILTDKLFILLIAANKNKNFEDERTFFSLVFKVREKFIDFLGRICQISLKGKDLTMTEYFSSPEKWPDFNRIKIKKILAIGYSPKNNEVAS